MSKNEFDELLQRKFDQQDIAYNPGNWERLSRQLHDVQPRKNNIIAAWPALTGIAATIALLVVLPMLWLRTDKTNIDTRPIVLEEHTTPVRKAEAKIAIEETTKNVQAVVPPVKNTKRLYAANKKHDIIITNSKPVTTDNKPLPEQYIESQNTDAAPKSSVVASNKIPKDLFAQANNDIAPASAKTARTSINLIGGLNYNAASAGYMLGASANRKLNDKLYVEGNIAFVNSGMSLGSSNTGYFADQFDANTQGAAAPTKGKVQQPVNYNLQYLQFSPVLGYNISERFTLGGGPDLQQLLNNSFYNDREIPALDMGVIGKAEYGITKKLKAGLQYRAGLNNAIQHEKKYEERNYMQVQLKYSIFNK